MVEDCTIFVGAGIGIGVNFSGFVSESPTESADGVTRAHKSGKSCSQPV